MKMYNALMYIHVYTCTCIYVQVQRVDMYSTFVLLFA